MKKVLYVCPNSKRAGAEAVTYMLMKYHERSQWQPFFYCLSEGPFVDEVRKLNVSCFTNTTGRPAPRIRKPWGVFKEAHYIASIVARENIDLIHGVTGYGHLFGGLAASLTKIPAVWFQHGPTGPLDYFFGQIPSKVTFVNSRFTAQEQSRYHARTEAIKKIDLGVEAFEFTPSQTPIGDRGKTLTFGIVARIAPMKGHKLVVEALAEVHRQLPDSQSAPKPKLKIIGDAFMPSDQNYLCELKQDIKKFGLESFVEFAGHIPVPQPAMLTCDAIINASVVPEPFGLSIVEAMTLGLPVIAPRSGGPQEIISDQKDGLLFEPNDSAALASQILLLTRNHQLRIKLGQAGYSKARSQYTAERMTRAVEAVYSQVFSSVLSFKDTADDSGALKP